MSEDIVIRNITEADIPKVASLVQRVLKETDAQKASFFDEANWRWQYTSSEIGALVVIADDEGTFAGSFHYAARDMLFDGQVRKMVLLQDLGVLPEYRRRGLFLKMAEHANQQMPDLEWDVTYSLPNHRSFPGFVKHLGYTHADTVQVYIRPLLPGKALAEKLPIAPLWNGLGKVGMLPYDTLFPLKSASSNLRIEPITHFDDSVNELSKQFVQRAGMGGWRTADFLNWRFIKNPGQSYRIFGAWENDTLQAYLVTRITRLFGTDAFLLMDMGCRDGQDVSLHALVGESLRIARSENIAVAVLMGRHPLFPTFWRQGFLPIPNKVNPRPLNFIVREHTERVDKRIYEAENWFLTLADWDVL